MSEMTFYFSLFSYIYILYIFYFFFCKSKRKIDISGILNIKY